MLFAYIFRVRIVQGLIFFFIWWYHLCFKIHLPRLLLPNHTTRAQPPPSKCSAHILGPIVNAETWIIFFTAHSFLGWYTYCLHGFVRFTGISKESSGMEDTFKIILVAAWVMASPNDCSICWNKVYEHPWNNLLFSCRRVALASPWKQLRHGTEQQRGHVIMFHLNLHISSYGFVSVLSRELCASYPKVTSEMRWSAMA